VERTDLLLAPAETLVEHADLLTISPLALDPVGAIIRYINQVVG
jgi:hypothetical protein